MSRFRVLAAGIAVAAVAVLATGGPASAHSELQSSSPATQERLATAPTEVTLTFSADVLDMGAVVIVADGAGTDWTADAPSILGGVVTVPLRRGMPDAGYELRWRVVSSDGHPIAGVIPFTVGDGTPIARSSPPVEAGAGAGNAASVEKSPQESQIAQENEGALRVVLIGAAGAVVAAGVFIVIQLLRRGTAAGGPDDAVPPPSDKS